MAEIEDIFSALGGAGASNVPTEEEAFSDLIDRLVPDPNQVSIPSEPFDDPVVKNPEGVFSGPQFFSNQATEGMADRFVLQNLLKQFESIPSVRGGNDEFTFPGIDIFALGMNKGDRVSERNLAIGRNPDFDLLIGREL